MKTIATLALALALTATGFLSAVAQQSQAPQKVSPLEKAQKIRLSKVHYDGLPLSEVLKHLQQESKVRDPDRTGVKITLAATAKEKASAVIQLDLENVSLSQALARVAQNAGLQLKASDSELILTPPTPKR